jgi:transposase
MVDIGELIMILELHRQGLSISAIAWRAGVDRKTVRKYIASGAKAPQYGPRAPRPRLIDSFVDFVTQRVREYPELTESRLLREIRELGY